MKQLVFSICLSIAFMGTSLAQSQKDNLAVDHLYIWCDDQTEVRDFLKKLKFFTRVGNEHAGQGTIGSYIAFSNIYIEFIGISNREDFENNVLKNNLTGMALQPDWKTNDSSPFGIGLHFKDTTNMSSPFQVTHYRQAWMQEGTHILWSDSNNTYSSEPQVFIVPKYMKYNSKNWGFFTQHPNNIRTVTSIQISTTSKAGWSETIKTVNNIDNFEFKIGSEDLMILIFDNNVEDKNIDFRPNLPLLLKY